MLDLMMRLSVKDGDRELRPGELTMNEQFVIGQVVRKALEGLAVTSSHKRGERKVAVTVEDGPLFELSDERTWWRRSRTAREVLR